MNLSFLIVYIMMSAFGGIIGFYIKRFRRKKDELAAYELNKNV